MTEDQISQHAGALTGVGGWLLDGSTLQLTWTAQTCRLHGLAAVGGLLHLDAALAHVDLADRDPEQEPVP